MSVRIGRPVARHRKNDPGCFTTVGVALLAVAVALATITRRNGT